MIAAVTGACFMQSAVLRMLLSARGDIEPDCALALGAATTAAVAAVAAAALSVASVAVGAATALCFPLVMLVAFDTLIFRLIKKPPLCNWPSQIRSSSSLLQQPLQTRESL